MDFRQFFSSFQNFSNFRFRPDFERLGLLNWSQNLNKIELFYREIEILQILCTFFAKIWPTSGFSQILKISDLVNWSQNLEKNRMILGKKIGISPIFCTFFQNFANFRFWLDFENLRSRKWGQNFKIWNYFWQNQISLIFYTFFKISPTSGFGLILKKLKSRKLMPKFKQRQIFLIKN